MDFNCVRKPGAICPPIIVPFAVNLVRDKVVPQYEKLGVLSYAELEDNFDIDWADMSKPYETQEEIEKAISGG